MALTVTPIMTSAKKDFGPGQASSISNSVLTQDVNSEIVLEA